MKSNLIGVFIGLQPSFNIPFSFVFSYNTPMKKNLFIIISVLIFAFILQKVLSSAALFQNLELMTYDLRTKLVSSKSPLGRKLVHADKDIVIVGIDDYSLRKLRESYSTRHEHQDWEIGVWRNIVNFIEEGEPKAVMFDMVFEKLTSEPWYNRTFATSLMKYDNIILGTYLDNPVLKENSFSEKIDLSQNDYLPTATPLNVSIDSKKMDKAITYTQHSPVNALYTRNNTMGVVNNVIDNDSFIRKNQPIYKLVKDNQVYYMPSLAFAGFMKYMGEGGKVKIKENKLYYRGRVIPLNDDGTVNMNWHKLGHSYTYIPVAKILLSHGRRHDLQPDFFKDKYVIIGKTASGANLDLSSLVDSSYLGPEANATALDNYINDSIDGNVKEKKFVSEVSKPLQVLITIGACLLVVILGLVSKNAFIGCLNGFISIVAFILFAFWLFVNPESRLIMPIMVPMYYLVVTSGIVFGFRYHREITKKASMMDTFGKFVSPKVLSTILKNPKKMPLKSAKKRITILFCDVKDFSALSEKNNPEKLISNLNDLFKEIVNIIFENNGTVDKFIGDCIMVYWGDVPSTEDHEYLAVKTALEIKKKINELKIVNAKENKILFDVKIGINTGDAILGLAGTDRIMNYTAMGDAVNTASRLESSCAGLNKDILISKNTYDAIKNKIIVLEVGQISLKGKEEQIEVFEPIGIAENISEEEKKAENE